jgi:23S rRNA pseudouridine955/2504/2580 synthase
LGPRFGRMFLHAYTTQLAHPISGEPLALTAPLPPDCSDFLQSLKAKPQG